MHNQNRLGHICALITIVFWGTTFVSTKLLLTAFQPVEILFFRFVLGLLALFLACPHRLRGTTPRQELTFAAAGLTGICLYYLLENIALTYTLASNIGVIVSTAPFFTAILFHLVGEERLRPGFLLGFAVSMLGIVCISLPGTSLEVNPIGDLLAVLAAIVWAFYSLFIKKIGAYGYNTIQTTRRVFLYGILFMIPALGLFGFRLDLERLANPMYLGNLVYLGLGASALCFVTWNIAVKALGAVKTSVYLYTVPVITVVASALVLHEQMTAYSIFGTLLTLVGLALSQRKPKAAQRTDA